MVWSRRSKEFLIVGVPTGVRRRQKAGDGLLPVLMRVLIHVTSVNNLIPSPFPSSLAHAHAFSLSQKNK